MKALFQSSICCFPCLGVLLQFCLESVSLFFIVHEFLNTHLKGQSPIVSKHLKEVQSKVPSIPGVQDCTFLLCHGTKMEFITITALEEERTWDFIWSFRCGLDQNLSGSCLDCAQTNELRVVALKHELEVCVRYHMFLDQRSKSLTLILNICVYVYNLELIQSVHINK